MTTNPEQLGKDLVDLYALATRVEGKGQLKERSCVLPQMPLLEGKHFSTVSQPTWKKSSQALERWETDSKRIM